MENQTLVGGQKKKLLYIWFGSNQCHLLEDLKLWWEEEDNIATVHKLDDEVSGYEIQHTVLIWRTIRRVMRLWLLLFMAPPFAAKNEGRDSHWWDEPWPSLRWRTPTASFCLLKARKKTYFTNKVMREDITHQERWKRRVCTFPVDWSKCTGMVWWTSLKI